MKKTKKSPIISVQLSKQMTKNMDIVGDCSKNIESQLNVDRQKHKAVQKMLKEDPTHKYNELDELRNKKKSNMKK